MCAASASPELQVTKLSLVASTQEIGEIRKTLNTEIEVLRNDFQDLRSNLKQQLEIAAGLAAQVCQHPAVASMPTCYDAGSRLQDVGLGSAPVQGNKVGDSSS